MDLKYKTKRHGATLASLKKVTMFLETQEEMVTPSKIIENVKMKWGTLQTILDYLDETNIINIVSNGKTSFIELKKGGLISKQN